MFMFSSRLSGFCPSQVSEVTMVVIIIREIFNVAVITIAISQTTITESKEQVKM